MPCCGEEPLRGGPVSLGYGRVEALRQHREFQTRDWLRAGER
jgi:hypothetical protein